MNQNEKVSTAVKKYESARNAKIAAEKALSKARTEREQSERELIRVIKQTGKTAVRTGSGIEYILHAVNEDINMSGDTAYMLVRNEFDGLILQEEGDSNES
jgi:uncharacterized membrane protein YdbT with pleckstrin-like domain